MATQPKWDIRAIDLDQARSLLEAHHGYRGCGRVQTYAFGVFEADRLIAAYLWNPPAPGAAKQVSPGCPPGTLALTRMVAVPKSERNLKHISKPLRWIMHHGIDRTRYPVLLTYSDAGQGHTGYVYQCSGWTREGTARVPYGEVDGVRRSVYSAGARSSVPVVGTTEITRWTHRATPRGTEGDYMAAHGWHRVPTGRLYRSGAPAYTWTRAETIGDERPPEGGLLVGHPRAASPGGR